MIEKDYFETGNITTIVEFNLSIYGLCPILSVDAENAMALSICQVIG
jgi:hypothetical protein